MNVNATGYNLTNFFQISTADILRYINMGISAAKTSKIVPVALAIFAAIGLVAAVSYCYRKRFPKVKPLDPPPPPLTKKEQCQADYDKCAESLGKVHRAACILYARSSPTLDLCENYKQSIEELDAQLDAMKASRDSYTQELQDEVVSLEREKQEAEKELQKKREELDTERKELSEAQGKLNEEAEQSEKEKLSKQQEELDRKEQELQAEKNALPGRIELWESKKENATRETARVKKLFLDIDRPTRPHSAWQADYVEILAKRDANTSEDREADQRLNEQLTKAVAASYTYGYESMKKESIESANKVKEAATLLQHNLSGDRLRTSLEDFLSKAQELVSQITIFSKAHATFVSEMKKKPHVSAIPEPIVKIYDRCREAFEALGSLSANETDEKRLKQSVQEALGKTGKMNKKSKQVRTCLERLIEIDLSSL